MIGHLPSFDLGHPDAPLERLRLRLGLGAGAFTESLRRIDSMKNLEVPAGLVDEHKKAVVELVQAYGEALEGSRIETLYDPIDLKPGLTEQRIETILEENRQRLGEEFAKYPFALRIKVDKQRVLETCLTKAGLRLPAGAECLYFFSSEAFGNELSKPTPVLERWWGEHQEARLVVVVPRWKGPSMVGPYLAVVGADYARAVPRLTAAPSGIEAERVQAPKSSSVEGESAREEPAEGGPWTRFRRWLRNTFIPDVTFVPKTEAVSIGAASPSAGWGTSLTLRELSSARSEVVNWEREWLAFLTPLHLQVEDRCANDEPVARLLRLHRVNMAILFTADRVHEPEAGKLQAVYQAPGQAVVVRLADPVDDQSTIDAAATAALTRIALGAYDGSFALRLVRSTLADALKAEKVERRFEVLASGGAALLEEVEISWRLFKKRELDEFMAQVQALEDYVAETVRAFADQSSAMIKSLSETMLAAVAVLLGSFIGALLKEDFDQRILTAGAALYLLYLILFPVSYDLGQRRDSYHALAEQFEARRKLFYRRLFREKVDRIVGDHVDRIRKRFEYWFRRTLLTYWAVACLLLAFIIAIWWFRPPPPDPGLIQPAFAVFRLGL